MGYKIQKIYVGTQQVRPGEITETYTVPNTPTSGSNYQWQYINIAKSGYTIKQIVIESDVYCPSSGSFGGQIGIVDIAGGAVDGNACIGYYLRLGGNNISNYKQSFWNRIKYNNSNIYEWNNNNNYDTSMAGKTNHLKATITNTSNVTIYCGITYNKDLSSYTSYIDNIFSLGTLYFSAGAYTSSPLSNNTITVTYAKA